MFIAAQFTIVKCWKQPKCPSVNEWIKKLWYVYTMEYNVAERKKELLPFTTALFVIAKSWKQPKYPSTNEWIKNCGTSTQWNTTQQKEKRNSYPV